MIMPILLVSITLAVMTLLVKLGVIKKQTQEKVTKWILSYLMYIFQSVIKLLIWLRLISPDKGVKLYAKAISCFFDNLQAGFVVVATVFMAAAAFVIIYLVKGGLPEITADDWQTIGINLPINYQISRWCDLACLFFWLFANLTTYKFIRRVSTVLFIKGNIKLFWRVFRSYYLLFIGAFMGLAAVLILGGAVYGLLVNVLLILAFRLLEVIGKVTINCLNSVFN